MAGFVQTCSWLIWGTYARFWPSTIKGLGLTFGTARLNCHTLRIIEHRLAEYEKYNIASETFTRWEPSQGSLRESRFCSGIEMV